MTNRFPPYLLEKDAVTRVVLPIMAYAGGGGGGSARKVYERVGISRIEVYERVGKSVI